MKKFLPILIILAVLVGIGVLVMKNRGQKETPQEEEVTRAIPEGDLPYVVLTPHADRRRLDVGIYNIKATRFDYQILYTFESKGQVFERGFGGRDIKLQGKTEFVREGDNAVVFGSESSGAFKYDEGVENGSIEITYRDEKGKATGRAESKWHLQLADQGPITSPDQNLTLALTGKPKGTFLTMHTMGLPTPATATKVVGPYGIFTSTGLKFSGDLEITLPGETPAKLVLYDADTTSWTDVKSTQSGSTLTTTSSSPGTYLVIAQ